MIRMRDTRTRLGMSLGDLEGATGISASVLSRYERGEMAPPVDRGLLVARALGVSLESLVGDQHERNAATPKAAETEVSA